MKQVLSVDETKSKYIMIVISIAMRNIKHKRDLNLKYAYEKLRRIKVERLQNCNIRGIDDIVR